MPMMENNNLSEYVDRLYLAAVRKAGDSHVAEDIVQETFLAAVVALSKGKVPDNMWGWLLSIMSNKYCDWLREKYNKPQISFDEYPFEIPIEDNLDDDSTEKFETIWRELGYLAKTHREVMIRFYMHGDTIEKIAGDLHIPIGTVKSRLNTGRKHIKEGVTDMENYTKQSYEPDVLWMSCSGSVGLDGEPFSLAPNTDKLTQNVLILAYPKPVTEIELAKALGVPVAFIEPIIEKMIDCEMMQRTDGGKVYTDFIIFTDGDRKATFKKQLDIADTHFDLFWQETEKALSELREKEYYKRQSAHGKAKLELHFCIKLLLNAHIDVRNEVTGVMPFSEYPYRKNGGRWFAMGNQYPPNYDYQNDSEFQKYGISGEATTEIKNFRDAKYLALRKYDTELGKCPNSYFKAEYVKWFYELLSGISREESTVGDNVLESADSFIESGVLVLNGTLELDIPVLTHSEYRDECKLASEHEQKLSRDIHDVLLPVFNSGYVKLPTHLKSVPKWQQYMFCGDSVPMAVILKAIEKGLLFTNVDCKVPASILVIEK
jgi:RNA polymerase sigma factor (sigma-70 family)